MAWVRETTGRTLEKSSDTSIAFSTALSPTTVGTTIVLYIATDNLTATTPTFTVSKPGSETASWVQVARKDSQSATAGAATVASIFVITTTVSWSGHAITVTTSGAVSAKVVHIATFTGGSSVIRGSMPTTTSTSSHTLTGANQPQAGDLAVAIAVNENNTSPPLDPDVEEWIAVDIGDATSGGGGSSNVGSMAAYRFVTATGDLTWNTTITGDGGVVSVALQPASTGKVGSATGSFGGTFAGSGRPRTFGTGAQVFGGTFTTSGRPRTFGVAATTLGFTGTAAGTTVATVTGTAAAAFGGTFATQGTDRALGTATATIGFTGTAAGIPKTRGTATATFGGTFTSSGTDRARGTATTALGFTGAATGSSLGQTVGTATAAFGFTGSTTGRPRTKGTATTTLTFTGTTTGVDRTLSTATTTLGFTTTTQGTTRKLGHIVAAIGFTGAANGNVGDAGAQALTIRAALEPNRWEGTLNLGWTADLRPTAWGAEFAVAAYAAIADPAAWEAS